MTTSKARELYREFCDNYYKENKDEQLRTWEELTKTEQEEWEAYAEEQNRLVKGGGTD